MNIMIEAQDISTAGGAGAIKTYSRNLVSQLIKRNVNNYCLSCFDLGGESDTLRRITEGLNGLSFNSVVCDALHYLVAARTDEKYSNRSYDEIMGHSADIYHFPGISVPARINGNCVVSIHDLFEIKDLQVNYLNYDRIAQQALFRRLKMIKPDIIADSKYLKNRILETGLCGNEDKISVVPFGYAPSVLFPEQDSSFISEIGARDGYILFFGAIRTQNSLTGALKAFESISRRFDGISFVICGVPAGQDFEAVATAIYHSPAFDRIIFMREKNVDDKTRRLLYSNALALLYPSIEDGNAAAALEAMACGCPVIVSDTGAFPEVAGDAGVLVNPLETEEIAAAIERVVNDESLRGEMAAKGLARAKGNEWDSVAAKTEAVYKSMAR